MSNYLDLKIGKKLRLYNFRSGVGTNNQKWGLFTYTPYENLADGSYKYGQKYSIVIDNIGNTNRDFKDGDSVIVANIKSVTAVDSDYQKNGTTIHDRFIKVVVDIKIDNNSNTNTNNNTNSIYNNNNSLPEEQTYDNSFANDDYDVPTF